MTRAILVAAIVAFCPELIHIGGGGLSVNKFWTPERIATLRELVDTNGFSAAAAHFADRSENAVRQACNANGISVAGKGAPRRTAVVRAPRRSAEERLEAQIAAKREELERVKAERARRAAQKAKLEAAKAAEHQRKKRERAAAKLEQRYAAIVERAAQMRRDIVAVNPRFDGPVIGAPAVATPTLGAVADDISTPAGQRRSSLVKGDVDIIRKRLENFVVPQLSKELGLTLNAVKLAIADIAVAEYTASAAAEIRKTKAMVAKMASV